MYKHHSHTSHCQQQQFVFNFFSFHFSAWATRLLKVKLKWHLTSREKSAREKIYRLIARFVLFEMCLWRKKEFLWNNIERHEIIDARSLETLLKVFFFLRDGDDFEKWRRRRQTVVICRDTVTWTTSLLCLGPAAELKAQMSIYSVTWLRSMGKCQGKRHSRLRLGVIKDFVCKRSKKLCFALSCSWNSEARWKNRLNFDMWLHILTANRRKLISKAMRWMKHVFYRTFREGETDSARHLHLFELEHVFECWLSTVWGFVSWCRLRHCYPRLIGLSFRFISRCTPDHQASTTVCMLATENCSHKWS